MSDFTEHTLTEAVRKRFSAARDPRLREIMQSLVTHLHDFVREVGLTEAEWLAGIRFLTATGQCCDDLRQEFILLSDTLGVSMLVDAINHRRPEGATESTVLGPFYREGVPERPGGASIAGDTPGSPTLVSGRVTGPDGRPVAGARLDVWHAAPDGLYDNQVPEREGFNLRGVFRTDAEGRYAFRTVKPSSYAVPIDGPVGVMLRALGGHHFRPAHIHFIVSAEGYVPLTTHIFVAGDPYLDNDAVFAVKGSLIVDFERHDSVPEAAARGVTGPFYTAVYDFGLEPRA